MCKMIPFLKKTRRKINEYFHNLHIEMAFLGILQNPGEKKKKEKTGKFDSIKIQNIQPCT